MQIHELACSFMSLHAVPWACMQFHKLEHSSMSLYVVHFLVGAAHKNLAVLIFWCTEFYSKVQRTSLRVWGKAQGVWGHRGLCRGWPLRRLHSLLLHQQLLRPALVGDWGGQADPLLQNSTGMKIISILLFKEILLLSLGLYWNNPWLHGRELWLHWQKSWAI